MKRIIPFFALFTFISMIMAQEKTDVMIFGDVKSTVTGEHIPFATIAVKDSSQGTTADDSGHFKLTNIPVGTHKIVAQAVGYKYQEKEITVEKGQTLNLYFELEDDVLNLEQVVVTGTRTRHFVKDVPVRTEVITAEGIENKNACNIYQALEGMPGVRVENQCQSCNFTMIRMQGLGAEHTQVLINGLPMYSGLAGVYGLQQISTVDIDQIEVVKGAGSALYGSGAIAGAINIVTKKPSFNPSTKVDVQMGSFNTNKYDITSSMRNEKGNIGLNLYAQRYTEGAIDETGAGINRQEVMNSDGISDRVMTNLTNAGFGLFVEDIFGSNDELVIRGKSIFESREGGTVTDDYYRNPLTDGTENVATDRYEATLEYNKGLWSNSELNYSFSYVNHNRTATNDSYLGDYMETHSNQVPDLRDMRPYLAHENSFTSTLSFKTQMGNHNLIAGVQTFIDDIDESGMYVVVNEESEFYGASYRSTADKYAREFGAFVQDEWNPNEKLTLVPGIRIDHHLSGESYTSDKQVFATENFPVTEFQETSVNPRFAVKYELTDKITLRANTGTGFRAPYGFSEDLHLCSGSPRVWKSSELEPETSLSYNFSADYYASKFRISTNFYRTELRNKIGFTDADQSVAMLGYDYQWKNIDDAYVQGVEFSVIANITTDLDMGIDLTWNKGEYNNVREDWIGTEYEEISRNISRFPATTGYIKMEYTPKNWSVVLTGNYQGSMYVDYFNTEIDAGKGDLSKIKITDPFMIFNARLARDLNNFRIYVGANNIFNYIQDERYLDDAAFLYAPVFGTMLYAGVSVNIMH